MKRSTLQLRNVPIPLTTAVLILFGLTAFSQTRKPAAADENLVLFAFDDHSLPLKDNLKITLNQPQRYSGNPVFVHGSNHDDPDGYGVALYGTVIHDKGKFRMWYLAWPNTNPKYNTPEEKPDNYRPIGYAESVDGIHWTKPNLGLVEFRGSKENNLILIEPASHPYSRPVDFNAVLFDPQDPDPARRYKIAYIVSDIKRRIATTVNAVSPDGLRWKLLNTEPYTRSHFENTGLIRFQGDYYASGQNLFPFGGNLPDGSPAGRVMTVLRSPDFIKWPANRSIAFFRDGYQAAPEGLGEEVHMGAGLWNRGNIILGLYGIWHGTNIKAKPGLRLAGLTIDLGFVISNDALHYREPVPRFVMVPRGSPGQWDSQCLLQGNAFYNSETETYIWYSHWDLDNQLEQTKAAAGNPRQAIGLLKLPRDRFGYLSKLMTGASPAPGRGPRYDKGSVISMPVILKRSAKLYVNADNLTDAAPITIEILNKTDEVIRGYESSVSKDTLRAPVSWRAAKNLPLNQPFRIRVSWPDGVPNPRLYAMYVDYE